MAINRINETDLQGKLVSQFFITTETAHGINERFNISLLHDQAGLPFAHTVRRTGNV